MTRGLSLCPILLLAGMLPITATAGPWGREAGHSYWKLSSSLLATETLATPDGNQVEIPRFELVQVHAYGELGVGSGLTAIADLPLYHRTQIKDFDTASGIGDLRLGLLFALGETGGLRFALRSLAQAPTGDATKGGGILPTGSGAWESDSSLSVGRSFHGGYGFVETGVKLRGGGFRDGFLFQGQLGFDLGSRLDLSFRVHGLEPFGDNSPESRSSGAGLGDGVRYTTVGPSLALQLGGNCALEFDLEHSFHGRNLATGTRFRAGISLTR